MPSRLIVLLCLTGGSTTFPIGAFPALIPDLDRIGLSTMELGSLVAAFGFARMIVDVPVGLLVTRHLRIALVAAPVLLVLGIVIVGTGGPFPVLIAGRLLMGMAHALGMVTWLSTLLRHQRGSLGAALNAFELSAMLGMLGGVTVIGLLPKTLAWNVALLIACGPALIAAVAGPFVAAALPAAAPVPPSPHPEAASAASDRGGRRMSLVVLAFVAGTSVAITYSMIESFTIPLRASRDFALDRAGVARILMLAQLADISALLPVGVLADRIGAHRVLIGILVTGAGASLLVAFGEISAVTAGALVLGFGMAGWMLPLAVLRRETPTALVAWRTALYRVCVDAGLFLGPFLAGVLGSAAGTLSGVMAVILVTVAAVLAIRARGTE